MFNEFVGVDCLIGSSWMMPIQVFFFFLVCVFWKRIDKIDNYSSVSVSMLVVSIMSIIIGYLRSELGINLPTAFFLLLGISFLGLKLKFNGIKAFGINLIIYEVALFISAHLSYSDVFLRYIIAYNLGILLFIVFMTINAHIPIMSKLGDIGFVFFLGPAVTNSIIDLCSVSFQMPRAFEVCVQFAFAVLFAIVLHKYVELPILKIGKRIENRL